ncbi:hypothetical protein CPB86DRAFT_804701 [Serendipita vermifera]|nr:hypothetical protein CPB86DRAFT_804701 [Serendipita vermifera]
MSFIPISTERGYGKVTILLKKNEPLPPLPYELQNVYPTETWTTRVQLAAKTCKQWSRPIMERIYFFCVIAILFIVPWVITSVVLMRIYGTGRDGRVPPEKFFEYRAAGMGIFIGVFLLFWGPLIFWKILGRRRLRALERQWLELDRATGGGGFLPRWKLSKPGIFSSNAAIQVTLPSVPVVISVFHPNAPLPPYINPAPSDHQTYGYGYSNEEKTGRV